MIDGTKLEMVNAFSHSRSLDQVPDFNNIET